MKLSYYLFNENVNNFEDMYLSAKVNGENSYIELTPKHNEINFEFKALIQKNKTKTPKWMGFLKDDLEIPQIDEIKNSVNSFVILIKITNNDRPYYFAVTGGFGFTALNRDNLENNFGLKFALNSIDSKELKALDVRNIDLKTKQKRVLINKGSELGEFDIDFEQDLVNLVSGKSKNEDLGTTIKGSTSSLNLNSNVTFKTLGEKCEKLLEIYLSNDYKENFGFIDNIKSIKEKQIIDELNLKLFEDLKNNIHHNISLAYPDMIEYDRCTSYKIRYRRQEIETDEVILENIYQLIDMVGIDKFDSVGEVNKIKITGFEDSGNPITKAVSLNHFIVYEVEIHQTTYIYSLNNWYEIDQNYYNKVDEGLNNIELLSIENFLTNIKNGESEGDYNLRQDSEVFLCLDKKNFQIPNSRSRIEICDLYSKDKHFVCVKKDTASATLSHLFAQGSISMTLLKEMREYRTNLVERIVEHFPNEVYDVDNFPYDECTLIYAISSEKNGDIRSIIPFFSKVNLLHHVNLIRRLGIVVKIYKIEVDHV